LVETTGTVNDPLTLREVTTAVVVIGAAGVVV